MGKREISRSSRPILHILRSDFGIPSHSSHHLLAPTPLNYGIRPSSTAFFTSLYLCFAEEGEEQWARGVG